MTHREILLHHRYRMRVPPSAVLAVFGVPAVSARPLVGLEKLTPYRLSHRRIPAIPAISATGFQDGRRPSRAAERKKSVGTNIGASNAVSRFNQTVMITVTSY